MIQITLQQCNFGVQRVEAGVQMNIFHEPSQTVYQVPFGDNAVGELAKMLATVLTDEQKKMVAPLFTSGVIIPGVDFEMPPGHQQGPQG